ncbi:MAG: alanine racemase [Cyanobacteria bacterium]|jgi:alanine racemase|nr:alanine racemase [Cyanobacteria bacterium GSL.Bin1]
MVLSQNGVKVSSQSSLNTDRAWVEINETALSHNVKAIKQLLSPDTRLMAVVKADAYGHGAVKVAKTVINAGGDAFAVATLQEGIDLRLAEITAPILVLGAINTVEEIQALSRWHLEPTLCSPQQGRFFAETLRKMGKTLPVHLKLDTGMSRLGVLWEDAVSFVSSIRGYPELEIKSLYSHLATADEKDDTFMRLQRERFESAIAQLKTINFTPPCLHLANSAATLRDARFHYDLVRIGLALYGLSPSPELAGITRLKPALQVKARITQIKDLPAGAGVSYGHQFVTDRPCRIAVVGIGYADGVPRNLSNRLKVLLKEKRVSQIGAITMDQLMLDVTHCDNVQPGDMVTLIGEEGQDRITAEDWAQALGTISWEILCGFKHRLPRIITSVTDSD